MRIGGDVRDGGVGEKDERYGRHLSVAVLSVRGARAMPASTQEVPKDQGREDQHTFRAP